MVDLITRARALYNLNNQATTSDESNTIAALVSACSAAIEEYCRRDFVSTTYVELYSGNGERRLFLRHDPIISIQSVRYRPITVLKIINNDTITNQQALVTVTATSLTLYRNTSGVPTTDPSVKYAGNATLGAIATAVNALGIKARTVYSPMPVNWPAGECCKPDEVFAQIQAGVLNAKSIGWLPTKAHFADESTQRHKELWKNKLHRTFYERWRELVLRNPEIPDAVGGREWPQTSSGEPGLKQGV